MFPLHVSTEYFHKIPDECPVVNTIYEIIKNLDTDVVTNYKCDYSKVRIVSDNGI